MCVGGVSNKQKVQRGCLGFICTDCVLYSLRAYHSCYNLCEWCPLEWCDTVAQLPAHFILGNYLFPSGYSLTQARTIEQKDKETQDQSISARGGLFHFNWPLSRAAHFLPGAAAFSLTPSRKCLCFR